MNLKFCIKLFQFIFLIVFLISCKSSDEKLKIVDTILNDKSSFYHTNLDVYKKKNAKLPIGIFDSGTGGLTVFDAIVNFDKYNNKNHSYAHLGDSIRDFNRESFIYLADQANMPYGNYESQNKTLLLKEHILKDVQFLLNNKYYERSQDISFKQNKSAIKAIVIACNTATAYGKVDIEEFIKKANLDIKVIGVIGAGVRAALENISDDENYSLAVMATAGTVSSNGYVNEIKNQLNEKSYKNKISIFQQAGVGLADAIDEIIESIDKSATKPRTNYIGPSDKNEKLKIDIKKISRYNFDWTGNKMLFNGTKENPTDIQINSVENYISYHITTLLEKILNQKNSLKLKSIILGCTHYPFYTDIFKEKIESLRMYKDNSNFIYKDILADEIDFIDPSIFTAKELYEYLSQENLFNNDKIENSEFFISVPNFTNKNIQIDNFGNFTYDYKYGRNENEIQEYVKVVPFNKTNISESISERLYEKIPYTYSLIKEFNTKNLKTSFLLNEEKLQ